MKQKRQIKQKKLQNNSATNEGKITLTLFLPLCICNFKLSGRIHVWLEIIIVLVIIIILAIIIMIFLSTLNII